MAKAQLAAIVGGYLIGNGLGTVLSGSVCGWGWLALGSTLALTGWKLTGRLD